VITCPTIAVYHGRQMRDCHLTRMLRRPVGVSMNRPRYQLASLAVTSQVFDKSGSDSQISPRFAISTADRGQPRVVRFCTILGQPGPACTSLRRPPEPDSSRNWELRRSIRWDKSLSPTHGYQCNMKALYKYMSVFRLRQEHYRLSAVDRSSVLLSRSLPDYHPWWGPLAASHGSARRLCSAGPAASGRELGLLAGGRHQTAGAPTTIAFKTDQRTVEPCNFAKRITCPMR
jgi:hypothetical protein